jgi:hypothetical protein
MEKAKPETLRFGSVQDALSFARDGIEQANCRARFHAIEFVERYVKAETAIELKSTAGLDARKFDALSIAVPAGGKDRAAATHRSFCQPHSGTNNTHRN